MDEDHPLRIIVETFATERNLSTESGFILFHCTWAANDT